MVVAMRYKLGAAWHQNGQYLHEAGKEFDNGNVRPLGDVEFWKSIGLLPPADACAQDLDAALVLWSAYSHIRHRLFRQLSPEDQAEFERLTAGHYA
jgi:hypothetical protein